MANLTINSVQANPLRISVTMGGATTLVEYPNKAAVADAVQTLMDTERFEIALLLLIREWAKTDPQLNNVIQLIGKTCTISAPQVTIP